MSSIALRMWILSTLVVACAPNRDGSLSPAAPPLPPLSPAQTERVQRLQQSISNLQSMTARAFLNQMDMRVANLLFDEGMRAKRQMPAEDVSLWVRKLRSRGSGCEGRSVLPVSKSQIPEAGYFYFIIDARSCPLHIESRLQVIRSAKGADTSVVMTLRYTLQINDPQIIKQFGVTEFSFDGDIHVRKLEQDYEMSGYAYGTIRPMSADPITLSIHFKSGFQRNQEPQIQRRTRVDFKDFSAEL